MDTGIFLNHGKHGYYLNHYNGLYSLPHFFQKQTFKLDYTIKIIDYKNKMKEQQIENKSIFG